MVGVKTPYVSCVFLIFRGSYSTLATFCVMSKSPVGEVATRARTEQADFITRVLLLSDGVFLAASEKSYIISMSQSCGRRIFYKIAVRCVCDIMIY